MTNQGPLAVMAPASPRRRGAFLLIGAIVMVAAAWAVAPMAGPPIAILAGLYGWLAGWFLRPPAPVIAETEPESAPVPVPEGRNSISVLRHDLRGILSPALLVTDRLLMHEDPAVHRAGEVVARTVQRITDRLEETREADPA
jgi:hypothetical protein